ncbi:rhombosortase [Alishewanella sp. HL-SH06]|uniref:rhombosortase n=1 Tax=Alishewanella sp. HL-SH06 TaxID=3461144 RepID=UPI0027466C35|nr:rhombosortase [Alishewanella sp. SMS8]
MLSQTIKSYAPYFLLGFLIFLLHFSPLAWHELLQYSRPAIGQGEVWRVLTGHLLHSNAYHLLMNMVGLLLIMLIHGHLPGRLAFGWQLLILGLGTSAGLWWLAPDMLYYVGLSGVLHGILCYGAVIDIKQGFRTGYLILAGVLVKILSEQFSAPDLALAAQINADVAIDAHLFGASVGCLLGLVLLSRTPRQ